MFPDKDFFFSYILHAKSIPFWRPYFYFIFHVCTSVFFGKWNFHQKCQFPFIDLTKLPINNDNVMFPYVLVSLRPVYIVIVPYIYIVTLVNPLYFLFLWFLWYIALDFVHLSILWFALYIALRGTRKIYLRSTISTVGLYAEKFSSDHCWRLGWSFFYQFFLHNVNSAYVRKVWKKVLAISELF